MKIAILTSSTKWWITIGLIFFHDIKFFGFHHNTCLSFFRSFSNWLQDQKPFQTQICVENSFLLIMLTNCFNPSLSNVLCNYYFFRHGHPYRIRMSCDVKMEFVEEENDDDTNCKPGPGAKMSGPP